MTQEEIKTELLKVAGNPELTLAGEQYLEGFSKKAHELMEKEALPLSSLVNVGFVLPALAYSGKNLYDAAGSTLEGESGDAAKQLGLAGLGALSTAPFLGGAGAGIGHMGLAMQRLAKGRKSPAFRALTGRTKGHSMFRRGLRAPGTGLLMALTKVLGPDRATRVGKVLASKGKAVSEFGPLRFMDRGQWDKAPIPGGFKGFASSMLPMIGADMALNAVTQPAMRQLEYDLSTPKRTIPELPAVTPKSFFTKIKEWDDANTPSRTYAQRVGLI